jgi:hypothetical protein
LSDRLHGGNLSRDFRFRGSSHPAEVLNRFPNPLCGDLAVGEFLHWGYAGQAVPAIEEPLVVVTNQVGELHFGREDSCAGVAGGLAVRVECDVVFYVNCEEFHGLCPLRGDCRVTTLITLVADTSKAIPARSHEKSPIVKRGAADDLCGEASA